MKVRLWARVCRGRKALLPGRALRVSASSALRPFLASSELRKVCLLASTCRSSHLPARRKMTSVDIWGWPHKSLGTDVDIDSLGWRWGELGVWGGVFSQQRPVDALVATSFPPPSRGVGDLRSATSDGWLDME